MQSTLIIVQRAYVTIVNDFITACTITGLEKNAIKDGETSLIIGETKPESSAGTKKLIEHQTDSQRDFSPLNFAAADSGEYPCISIHAL